MGEREPFPLYFLTPSQMDGKRRVDRLKQEYEKLGYEVYANYVSNSGCDVQVFEKGTGVIKEVMEVTNYKESTQMPNDRFQGYVKSLNWWTKRFPWVKKWLVISYEKNLLSFNVKKKQLDRDDITLVVVGHKDLD